MYIDTIRIIKYTYAMYGVRQINYENMPKKKKQVFVPTVYKNHIHLYIRLSTIIENILYPRRKKNRLLERYPGTVFT